MKSRQQPNPGDRGRAVQARQGAKRRDVLLGLAGEHYVCCELARRGLEPRLARRNAKAVDILVLAGKGTSFRIQVKTSAGRNNPRAWDVGKTKPRLGGASVYVFVNLWDDLGLMPEVFVVPASVVLEQASWHTKRPVFRLRRPSEEEFRAKWGLILQLAESGRHPEVGVGGPGAAGGETGAANTGRRT